jgi:hypothetical protein
MSGSGSTAPVLTDPAVPTTMHGTSPAASPLDLPAQRADVHAELASSGSTGSTRCRGREVGGLLNPRVRFGRRVDAKPAPDSGDAVLAHVPAGLRRARGQEADEVRHVAAADEQPAAVGG